MCCLFGRVVVCVFICVAGCVFLFFDCLCVCVCLVGCCLCVSVWVWLVGCLFGCLFVRGRLLASVYMFFLDIPTHVAKKRGGVLVTILGWGSNCARRRAQCDGHVHITIRKQSTCIQFRSSWNQCLSRYAPRARLRRLCDPLGEFVGSGSFARREI